MQRSLRGLSLVRSAWRVEGALPRISFPGTLYCMNCWASTTTSTGRPRRGGKTSKEKKERHPVGRTKASRAQHGAKVGASSTLTSATSVAAGGLSSTLSEEEARLAENDTRLAMRLLMSRHLSRESFQQRQMEARREEERQQLRASEEHRYRRMEEKTLNAMRLLGADGKAVGEGILPLFQTRSPAGRSDPPPSSNWRTLNPVGVRAVTGIAVGSGNSADDEEVLRFYEAGLTQRQEDEDDGTQNWANVSLEALCQPDISVYDSEHDHRIASSSVVGQEEPPGTRPMPSVTASPRAPSLSKVPLSPFTGLTENTDLPGERVLSNRFTDTTATSTLRRQLSEEAEDDDFLLQAYSGDDEDL